MTRGWLLSKLAWGLAALALFVAVATARAVLDGEREMTESDRAFDDDRLRDAIVHARRAASAYAPGAPHVERAFDRLGAIARGAEAAGKSEITTLAWEAERAAVLESQSLWPVEGARLDEANRNLARLATARSRAESGQGPGTPASAKAWLERERSVPQRGFWGALLPLGLLLSSLGLAYFGARAFMADGKVLWSRGRLGLALMLLGVACWAIAALRA